jgi:transposase InsO family protein
VRTAGKWLGRERAGDRQLLDRSSRPAHCPSRLWQQRVAAIERLRRLRMTAAEIAEVLELPLSTVSLWLKRIGLGKRSRLDPLEPPNRYERRHSGELVHIDIKRLARISARGAGHRMLGPQDRRHRLRVPARRRRRLLQTRLRRGPRRPHAACAIAFLRRAVAWYAAGGVTVRAVMTDNGSCYIAHDYQRASPSLGLKHLRIQPGRPRTNGKAERLIQTLLNEWAHARIYGSSTERTAALPLYLDRYNYRRPHGSLSHQPPASRLSNLLGNYT